MCRDRALPVHNVEVRPRLKPSARRWAGVDPDARSPPRGLSMTAGILHWIEGAPWPCVVLTGAGLATLGGSPRSPGWFSARWGCRSVGALEIGREVSITILTAFSLNSGENFLRFCVNYHSFRAALILVGGNVRKKKGTSTALTCSRAAWRAPV